MRISEWSPVVCSSDLLRLNEGLACIIKRPDHAVDQVPFAFHSFCGHGENLFDAPLPDMRRNGHNSADALVHRYAVPGLATQIPSTSPAASASAAKGGAIVTISTSLSTSTPLLASQ